MTPKKKTDDDVLEGMIRAIDTLYIGTAGKGDIFPDWKKNWEKKVLSKCPNGNAAAAQGKSNGAAAKATRAKAPTKTTKHSTTINNDLGKKSLQQAAAARGQLGAGRKAKKVQRKKGKGLYDNIKLVF